MAVYYPSATEETVREVAKYGGFETELDVAIATGVKRIDLRNDILAWTCRIDHGDTIAKMPAAEEPAPVAVLRSALSRRVGGE